MKTIYISLFQICSQKWFHLIGPFFRTEVENKTSRMQIYNIFIRSLYFLGKRNLISCNRHSQRSSCLRPLGARVAGESHHPASRGFLKEPWMVPFSKIVCYLIWNYKNTACFQIILCLLMKGTGMPQWLVGRTSNVSWLCVYFVKNGSCRMEVLTSVFS